MIKIEDYLPHAAPMVLVDKLCSIDEESVHCQVVIKTTNPYFSDKIQGVPAYIGVEFMAQTIGVWSGYSTTCKQQEPKVGFLLGARRYIAKQDVFLLGTTLDINATCIMLDNGMGVFKASIAIEGELVVTAQLNVYEPSAEKLLKIKAREE